MFFACISLLLILFITASISRVFLSVVGIFFLFEYVCVGINIFIKKFAFHFLVFFSVKNMHLFFISDDYRPQIYGYFAFLSLRSTSFKFIDFWYLNNSRFQKEKRTHYLSLFFFFSLFKKKKKKTIQKENNFFVLITKLIQIKCIQRAQSH